MVIADIVKQHPESAALGFLKYGINRPVSEAAVSAAILSIGEPFIADLSAAVANSYEYFTGLGGKKAKKKIKQQKQVAAAAAQKRRTEAAQAGLLPPRLPMQAMELLDSSSRQALNTQLQPQSAAAADMAAQVTAQIKSTPVNNGGFWDKIGNIISGAKQTTDNIREIRNPSSAGGTADSGGTAAADQQDKKTGKTWLIVGIAVVVVLVAVVLLTGPKKQKIIAK